MAEKIVTVKSYDLESGPSTLGMIRNQAFADEGVWFGEVRTEPGAVSNWHHHGDYTTYGYVVSGTVQFEFGPGGAETAQAGTGTFFRVPPKTIHWESNPNQTEQILIGVRVGAGPSVVNVDRPEPA